MAKYTEITSFEELLSKRAAEAGDPEKQDNLADATVEIYYKKTEDVQNMDFYTDKAFLSVIAQGFDAAKLPDEKDVDLTQFPFSAIKTHVNSVSFDNALAQNCL